MLEVLEVLNISKLLLMAFIRESIVILDLI